MIAGSRSVAPQRRVAEDASRRRGRPAKGAWPVDRPVRPSTRRGDDDPGAGTARKRAASERRWSSVSVAPSIRRVFDESIQDVPRGAAMRQCRHGVTRSCLDDVSPRRRPNAREQLVIDVAHQSSPVAVENIACEAARPTFEVSGRGRGSASTRSAPSPSGEVVTSSSATEATSLVGRADHQIDRRRAAPRCLRPVAGTRAATCAGSSGSRAARESASASPSARSTSVARRARSSSSSRST